MGFFNNKRKEQERMEEEKKRQESANKHFNGRKYSQFEFDYIYEDIMYDYIDELLKNMKSSNGDQYSAYSSYSRSERQKFNNHNFNQPSKSTALDNAYTLMKLDKKDDESTIKKKYRELSMKWHPDKFATDTKENQAIANRNFIKLNSAYDLIKKSKNIK